MKAVELFYCHACWIKESGPSQVCCFCHLLFPVFCRVDYTDALGRTRRCMKKDLSHVQSMVSSMQQTRPDKTSGMDGVTGCQSDSKPSTSSSGGVSIYTIPRDDFRFI